MNDKNSNRKNLEGLIRSVENRILWIFRDASNFEPYEKSWSFPIYPPKLEEGEKIIGTYSNSRQNARLIVMTNLGLHKESQEGWEFIDYCLIEQTKFQDCSKDLRDHLILFLKNGDRIFLPVLNGNSGDCKKDEGLYRMKNFLDKLIHSLNFGSHLKA